jgi:hypothetical protein
MTCLPCALAWSKMTASRPGQTIGATWAEIDRRNDVWLPPERMKTGKAHRAVLSKEAVAILDELADLQIGDLVFPGPQSNDHHEGNRALNDYLHYVIVNTWVAIWGMQIKDNARILEFMCAAAAIVGVELSDAAARKRLRTIFAETFRDRRNRKAAQSSPT